MHTCSFSIRDPESGVHTSPHVVSSILFTHAVQDTLQLTHIFILKTFLQCLETKIIYIIYIYI